MKKTIYSKFGAILVVPESYEDEKGTLYDLYLDGEFITDYQTNTPYDIKKFEYEIIEFFERMIVL